MGEREREREREGKKRGRGGEDRETVAEIRDLRTDRRMLLCSHRGVRREGGFMLNYANCPALWQELQELPRHTRTCRRNLTLRNKYTQTHTHTHIYRQRDRYGHTRAGVSLGVSFRRLCGGGAEDWAKKPPWKWKLDDVGRGVTCMETLLKDPPMTPAMASGLSSCRA